ncbi:uncharacterized protein VTP21DRAFT_11030 [Calcarisporiella thermophila]|uniref:uncharacterized protein n=1 Tax=Calcarisporiella thermophila TaxID=911321 RepID=UPI0037426F36
MGTFRAFQIFAANTNVGKTIASAGLCRAAASSGHRAILNAKDAGRSNVYYLKPIQTGYPTDCDASMVTKFAPRTVAKTLYTYPEPVSPHRATTQPPSDEQVLSDIRKYIEECRAASADKLTYMFIEGSGGVHSPVMSGTLQSDFYRPFRLPTVMVGDGRLGGISTTITSYESLRLRGYDISTILLFSPPDSIHQNNQFLERYLPPSLRVVSLPSPPELSPSPDQDRVNMEAYYLSTEPVFQDVVNYLEEREGARIKRLQSMDKRTREIIWWPFTQHANIDRTFVIDSAYKDEFTAFENKGSQAPESHVEGKSDEGNGGSTIEIFDGCASWWTQGLGHGSPSLSLAGAYAAGRYGHVIFPEATHEPALGLAELLLDTVGSQWASRVFYSDNGSTAMEVGLKMAFKAVTHRHGLHKNEPVEILGLDGSYHGDTIGAMDGCAPNVYNEQVNWYRGRGHWFNPPLASLKNGVCQIVVPKEISGDGPQIHTLSSLGSLFEDRSSSELSQLYTRHISSTLEEVVKRQGRKFGALLLEPVMMGAGGMLLVDPLFQRCLINVVRNWDGWSSLERDYSDRNDWRGLPVVFDEVFTGFWRLGARSGADLLGEQPDIASYAKLLTGGLVPLATTLSRASIFEPFLSSAKQDALLHGHSYTAHPVGCEVARTSVQELENIFVEKSGISWGEQKGEWLRDVEESKRVGGGAWSMWDKKFVHQVSHMPIVDGVVALGSVLALTLKPKHSSQGIGYASTASKSIVQALRNPAEDQLAVFARPLGNVVYLMASQITPSAQLRRIEETLKTCLEREMS